ncbi:hypothetical protein DIURU_005155 [Diutina rugosa]|uniref:Protein transport protein SFT2 n=1 Tax=Diutina rugosa TaxID=5481 RepID=A0A642UEG5_DIURU|nr:uncharacterized protein DIURU_005155 [Diutina rugosa]KAA8897556.1 hypothetical protein DIURU_005155 [Diutina rugosa]
MSAETNFRQSFANWSQRSSAAATNTTSGPQPVLAEWTDYVRSGVGNLYTQLPSYSGQTQPEEPGWFQLGRVDRLIGFGACLAASTLCFVLCVFMFPVLALRPTKFAMLWTMGSLLFIVSFGVLSGPVAYTKHLLSASRIPFTAIYFGSVVMTVWSALVLKSTVLVIISSAIELVAVVYYVVSYFPFGAQAITFFSSYIMGYVGGFFGAVF